ncbi:synaptonemal complex protein 3-like [Meriones unguiculatus]|uniref:synaptonemal complex protein 3-like n=1 Tax=Meriones unguiculatus TaxID=10047 RepID=UPI00293F4D17|nr:synaptonemal complex protein 3-like [Meriones unguiculatus]
MFPHGRNDSEESEGTTIEQEEHMIIYHSDNDQDSSASQTGDILAHINTALSAKRHRMETTAQEAVEGIDQKMKQIWHSHEVAVAKFNEDSAQLFMKPFEQWNSDFQKIREQHDKLINDFQQQEKIFQESRFIHMQILRTVKHVHEQFLKDLAEMEERNNELLTGAQNEIKDEMNKLQKN